MKIPRKKNPKEKREKIRPKLNPKRKVLIISKKMLVK